MEQVSPIYTREGVPDRGTPSTASCYADDGIREYDVAGSCHGSPYIYHLQPKEKWKTRAECIKEVEEFVRTAENYDGRAYVIHVPTWMRQHPEQTHSETPLR